MESDAELVAAVLAGQEQAFDRLVQRHKGAVFGLAFGFLKDFEAARDVSQETFLRAFLQLSRLANPHRLPSWLRTIAANTCRNYLRSSRERVELEHTEMEERMNAHGPQPERPDESLERRERRLLVENALARLSSDHREILTLYYLKDQSSAEVARYLDLTPEAVRQRLSRARRQLKEEMLEMVDDVMKEETPDEQFDRKVQLLLDQAREMFNQTEYSQAVPFLEQARKEVPEDTAVTLILSQAYIKGKTPGELERDPRPYHQSCRLLEDHLKRHPDDLLIRLELASRHSVLEPFDRLEPEHEEVLRLATGTPFEPLALLRMARLYNPRRKHQQAMSYYQKLIGLEPTFTAIARREMGVSHFFQDDLESAIEQFEKGIAFLEAQPPKYLRKLGQNLFGERLCHFEDLEDDRLVNLAQDHFWLAGLHARRGDLEAARIHLRKSLTYLDHQSLGSIRLSLVQELLHNVESIFPDLAHEAEIQALRDG